MTLREPLDGARTLQRATLPECHPGYGPHSNRDLDSTKWSGGAKPRELAGRMPGHTRLGPVPGPWAKVDLLGERHWVHKRFHHQIAAADRESGFSAVPWRPEAHFCQRRRTFPVSEVTFGPLSVCAQVSCIDRAAG